MPPRMFCFPNDRTILIEHSFETSHNDPYLGRNNGTLVLKQFLKHKTTAYHRAGSLDWRWSQQDMNLFIRWIYTQDLRGLDRQLPSDGALISLASLAGRLRIAELHDDILDALDFSHCRTDWTACASVTYWEQWRRRSDDEERCFWRKRHDYLVARAAADLSIDRLVENFIPTKLALQMLHSLKRRRPVRSAGGQPFPFHIMERFYLSDQPGDTSSFPINLSTPEPDAGWTDVHEHMDDGRIQAFPFDKLPAELRHKIYKPILWAPVPLKPGGPTFRWRYDTLVDTSLLRTCHWVYEEAKPIFQRNHFQIHALYGEELTHIVKSIGSELTINWYPEVTWREGVLESLVTNTRLKKLHLNFYPGNSLLDCHPSDFQSWFLFFNDRNAGDLDQNNLIYVTKDAPFLQKFLGLPGSQTLQLRGLESIHCQFHPSISEDVLTADDRNAFQAYVNHTLTQPRTLEAPKVPIPDMRYMRWVVDGQSQ